MQYRTLLLALLQCFCILWCAVSSTTANTSDTLRDCIFYSSEIDFDSYLAGLVNRSEPYPNFHDIPEYSMFTHNGSTNESYPNGAKIKSFAKPPPCVIDRMNDSTRIYVVTDTWADARKVLDFTGMSSEEAMTVFLHYMDLAKEGADSSGYLCGKYLATRFHNISESVPSNISQYVSEYIYGVFCDVLIHSILKSSPDRVDRVPGYNETYGEGESWPFDNSNMAVIIKGRIANYRMRKAVGYRNGTHRNATRKLMQWNATGGNSSFIYRMGKALYNMQFHRLGFVESTGSLVREADLHEFRMSASMRISNVLYNARTHYHYTRRVLTDNLREFTKKRKIWYSDGGLHYRTYTQLSDLLGRYSRNFPDAARIWSPNNNANQSNCSEGEGHDRSDSSSSSSNGNSNDNRYGNSGELGSPTCSDYNHASQQPSYRSTGQSPDLLHNWGGVDREDETKGNTIARLIGSNNTAQLLCVSNCDEEEDYQYLNPLAYFSVQAWSPWSTNWTGFDSTSDLIGLRWFMPSDMIYKLYFHTRSVLMMSLFRGTPLYIEPSPEGGEMPFLYLVDTSFSSNLTLYGAMHAPYMRVSGLFECEKHGGFFFWYSAITPILFLKTSLTTLLKPYMCNLYIRQIWWFYELFMFEAESCAPFNLNSAPEAGCLVITSLGLAVMSALPIAFVLGSFFRNWCVATKATNVQSVSGFGSFLTLIKTRVGGANDESIFRAFARNLFPRRVKPKRLGKGDKKRGKKSKSKRRTKGRKKKKKSKRKSRRSRRSRRKMRERGVSDQGGDDDGGAIGVELEEV